MKNSILSLSLLIFLSFPKLNFAQSPNLGTVANFTLFTKTGAVTNTGITEILGKIGTNAGPITGFVAQPGQQEIENSVTAQAFADLQIAYDEIYGRTQTFPTRMPTLGNGEMLIPGVYFIAEAASIEGDLFLNAQGNQNAIFIIKVQGALSPGPGSRIILLNGASSCNVFWAVQGAVSIATLSEMKGTFISSPGAMSMSSTSKLEGRLVSTAGAIGIDASTAGSIVCPTTTLPLSLIDFSATMSTATVELSWAVENEMSFWNYELERSGDGRGFNSIASITPGMNPGTSYRWTDQFPLSPLNFYRLKMNDRNGSFKYSKVLKISRTGKNGISIYPNPVEDHTIFLQFVGPAKGEQSICIYNTKGQKLMSEKFLKGEESAVRSIHLDKNLAPGIYILNVRNAERKQESIKFIIN